MDKALFQSRIETLEQGEYVQDPALYHYAGDAMYEYKKLCEALRKCCALQHQKIEMLRKACNSLTKSVTALREVNEELEEQNKLLAIFANPLAAAQDKGEYWEPADGGIQYSDHTDVTTTEVTT